MFYERLTALMTKLNFGRPHVIILDKCCQKRHTQSPKTKPTHCFTSSESFFKNNL